MDGEVEYSTHEVIFEYETSQESQDGKFSLNTECVW